MSVDALALAFLRTVLTAGLFACSAYAPPAQGGGTVIYPPARGEVILTAVLDGAERDIVRGAVEAGGAYTLTLPSPPPQVGTLAEELTAFPAAVQGAQCRGAPILSPPTARLLLLRAGRFLASGQVAGRLNPATSAVTLQASPVNVVLTTRQFLYADRPATLSGARTCTVTLSGGQAVPGRVQAALTLARGWNTLVTRTEQTSAAVTVSLSASAALSGVDWQYLPGTP
ncbi:hypothetical protein K7W42_01765 [Deinococcus sp. HMF7604]|uniref:hypothetical protein n=1 Tax=Deinococcus betulae TaxID=2873312 RepID=UPI001CCB8AAE|nr:hypothetical protein [Deinococcus betulae]MBZ9749582.1 hypothetical protein [Deinococcus betulae]